MPIDVISLTPGDVVDNMGERYTFIARANHPIYIGLQLVIWRLADGSVAFDALHPRQQVVGVKVDSGPDNFRRAVGME